MSIFITSNIGLVNKTRSNVFNKKYGEIPLLKITLAQGNGRLGNPNRPLVGGTQGVLSDDIISVYDNSDAKGIYFSEVMDIGAIEQYFGDIIDFFNKHSYNRLDNLLYIIEFNSTKYSESELQSEFHRILDNYYNVILHDVEKLDKKLVDTYDVQVIFNSFDSSDMETTSDSIIQVFSN